MRETMNVAASEEFHPKRKCMEPQLNIDLNGSLNGSLTNLSWLQKMQGSGVKVDLDLDNCKFESEHEDLVIDWKTNTDIKPPFSYITLIYMAMKSSNLPKVTLNDIYSFITDNFIFYRCCEPGWKVR
jgi:hypothetical protein